MQQLKTHKIILGAFWILSLLILNSCGMRRPELTNPSVATASYLHSGTEVSCNLCHDAKRPIIPIGPSYTFDHQSQSYGGLGDCVNCHSSQISWTGGQYSHSPQPNTCQNCHSAERPVSLVGNPTFNHSINGQADCFGCHAASTTAYNTLSDWAGAVATPSNLIGNKNISISSGSPTWSNTTITNITVSTKNFPLQMLHTSLQIPAGFTGTCTNCHSGASLNPPTYTGGVYHSSITAAGKTQPIACLDCHINTAPTGFVGAQGSGRSPASAEMKHDAVTWSMNSSGTWSPSTTKIVTQDCTICHTGVTPGTVGAWSNSANTAFHSKLTASGISQPSSCLDCHANNRPNTATGTQNFLHSNAGGMGDCSTCHSTNVAAAGNNFTTWVNTGVFSHAGQTSCLACHAGNRPTNTSGWLTANWSNAMTTFNLSTHASGTDCYSCHSSTLTATNNSPSLMSDWKGGYYNHSPTPSTCVNCHAYPSGTAAAPMPNLAGSGLTFMDHSGFGGQDCVGCHTSPPNYTSISGWGGATATPAGLVNGAGSTWNLWNVNVGAINYTTGNSIGTATVLNSTASLPQQMLHSSSQVPAGIKTNCAACHTRGMTATSGTRFHTQVNSASLTNCNSCHSTAAVPNGIVGPIGTISASNQPNMHHYATYTGGSTIVAAQDCSSCHKSTVGTSWKDGVFHANKGANTLANCFSCHIQRMPTALNTNIAVNPYLVDKFNHKSAVVKTDCISCHTASNTGPTGTWVTTVKIHTVIAASSFTECKSCHNATPSPDLWGRHSKHRGYDCMTCHNNTFNPGSIGNSTSGGTYKGWSTGTSMTSATCSQCH